MERGTFFDRLAEGDTWQERNDVWGSEAQILLIGTGTAGAFIARYDAYVGCEAPSSRMCDPEVDALTDQYKASVDPSERETLAAEAQALLSERFYKIPIYWFSFINAVGPRIANRDNWGEGQGNLRQPPDGVLRAALGKLETGRELGSVRKPIRSSFDKLRTNGWANGLSIIRSPLEGGGPWWE